MTREEQIVSEAHRQAELVNMNVDDFIDGAHWADANPKQGLVNLSQVWHGISEEPKFKAWFIAQIGENAFDTFVMEMDKNNSWVKWSKGINITRWAYIDDLLPKGGE